MSPNFHTTQVEYQKVLYNSPFRSTLEEALGEVAFKNMELAMKSDSPEIVSLRQEENRLTSEYEKLMASARFAWEGQELSMSGLGKYLTSPDRKVRKDAWQMVQDFMEEQSSDLDDIYHSLVKNRTAQATTLGYDNFVALGYDRLQRNCYQKEQVKEFRRNIKKYWVPFATKLQEKRAARLDVEQLTLVDQGVYFKEGNPSPDKTPEQILEKGLQMYQELSKETGEFMERMMQQEMFDVLSRTGKRQGGYMDFLPELRMPLIFANFNGTSSDVDVITHECGHAFQGYLAGKDDVREHWDITMETAETHSMSMEFFTNPWMHLFFGEDAARFCQMQLEDAICFIPYGCMVDEFQQIMYEYPKLTKPQRHEVWKRLEGQYRPHLDSSGMPFFEKGGLWQRQQHIYTSPFYYIDYCIAQICALQYKMLMTRDFQQAWESYLTLCRKSAAGYFTDMIQEVGLLSPFEEKTIENLVQQLNEYIP
jgi:M3 family oligoendopeptidase